MNYVDDFEILRNDFRSFQQSKWVDPEMTFLADETWLSKALYLASGIPMMGTQPSSASNSGFGVTPSFTPSFESPPSHSEEQFIKEQAVRPRLGNSAAPPIGADKNPAQARPRVEIPQNSRSRKGHKKSRQGCYNCKRRKIKCQETQPACENCLRKNIQCTYPSPKTLSALQTSSGYAPNPVSTINLQSTPTIFTLIDMRLFHHFLLYAFPHLPVGNDSTWVGQVPLIAHHNKYLMHAILGVAASHLELTTGQDLRSIAIHHRVLTIKGSNEAISKPNRTGADGDALLASCYALTFQSTYMSDGLPEFFHMVRGCSLLSGQLKSERLPMAFFLEERDHFEFMRDKLTDLPVINSELINGAERSLKALPALFDRPGHVEFFKFLTELVNAVKISSLKAYFKFILIYQGITKMDKERLEDFIDPNNHVAQILISHFLALEMVMSLIIDREWAHRTRSTPVRSPLIWISNIYRDYPARLKNYLEWPKDIGNAVADELAGKLTNMPIIAILKNGEGRYRICYSI